MNNNYFDYGKRPATDEEIAIAKRINAILDTMDSDDIERINGAVWDYMIEHGETHRKAYKAVWRFARKYGFASVEEVANGFCVD